MLITVLSVGLQDIAAGAISPAIASICAAYPEVSTSTVQLMVTLPTLSICVMCPIYGWLSNKIQPRKLMLFGLCLFVVAGMLPVFLNSLPLIMLCRILLGCGSGITIPAALSIIPVFYEGKLRDRLIGFNQGIGSLGCIFMQSIGGFFADINWHLSFLAYGIGMLSLILVFFFLPDIPMDKVLADVEKENQVNVFRAIPAKIYGLAAVFFVCMILVCIPTTNLALMVINKDIGTAATVGFALSVYTVGSLIGSFAFGYLKKAISIYTIPLSYIICGVGFYLVSSAADASRLYAYIFAAGLGMGCLMCGYIGRAAELTKLAYVAFSISVIMSANGLGNFIHPTFVDLLDNSFGNIYGAKAISFAGEGLVIMGVVVFIIYLLTAKRRINEVLH